MDRTPVEFLPWIDLTNWKRQDRLPGLSILRSPSFDRQRIEALKRTEGIPVVVVFPVRGDEELPTLEREIQILEPLRGGLIDEIWIVFGGNAEAETPRMASRKGVFIHYDNEIPVDHGGGGPSGKGRAMRGMIHHLCTRRGLRHPRAIIQFLDGDIREQYFHPGWVIDPVGAILWFQELEVAKIVYHRPWGGRLNAFAAALVSIFDHPGLRSLSRLVYLLSGEIAATLRFWLSAPFRENQGVEIQLLTALAFNQIQLRNGEADLDHVIQVYVGEMDHQHKPLRSSRVRKGLDAMAKEVFQTFLENLVRRDWLRLNPPLRFSDRLRLTIMDHPGEGGNESVIHLEWPSGEKTLPPLKTLPEVRASCPWLMENS
jgi:hypothetical protein